MKALFALLLLPSVMMAQTTPYMVQLLQKPNAISAKAWLQIPPVQNELAAGTNIIFYTDPLGRLVINAVPGTGPGSGTVTSVSAGNASPLFTTSVANPTTTPAISFTLSYIPLPNTPVLTNKLYATDIISGGIISPSVAGGLTNANDVLAIPNPGDVLIWSGSDWTNGPQAGATAGITGITNGGTGTTLLEASNPPVVYLKSISAGANVTLTDSGSNIVISSSGGGGSGLTDFLQYETNWLVTFREVASDIADNGATAFNGFGDVLTGSGVGGSAAVNTLHLIAQAPPGLWAQERCGVAANANVQYVSATFLAVTPYTNYSAMYQHFLCVRNTNNIRIISGFMAANLLGGDAITNQIMFRYSTASNDFTWHGVVSDGTNEAVVDTGVQLTNDGLYYLAFTKTGSNVVFNVNHQNVATISSNAVPNNFNRLGEGMAMLSGFQTLDGTIKTNLFRYFGYAVGYVVK